MTEKPDERRPRRNEDEPEVEGHRYWSGPEEPSEAGRAAALDEDADEGTDSREAPPLTRPGRLRRKG